MQLVVLAAGRGTRLRPVTDDRSKAMVPVAGRPLVERAVEPWLAAGLREVVFVVGPGDAEIREHFARPADLGITVRFVEQAQRRGMAHALSMAASMLHGDFALTACDSLVPADHVAALVGAHRDGSAVLSLMDVADELVSRSAAVEIDGDAVRAIVEKPVRGEAPSNTASLPHYILPHRILDLLGELEVSPRGEIELQSGIQRLIDEGVEVLGVRTGSRRQVSNPDDLLRVTIDELQARGGMVVPARWLDVRMVGPVVIDSGVRIGRDCVIGPDVYLEAGCRIGRRSTILRSVILRTAVVPDDSVVDGEVLV
ncbi:MAG: NDP-sugar synthase [Thermoanaerobaculales bacterium]|jgi:NDP-sugar pyrophosphorylase family protein|nr:NDP-sugar synthase [Thermoanaerobaculales bacterium]